MIKIAFYKGRGETFKEKLVSGAIRLWTRSDYSHVEIIHQREEDDHMTWTWFTSSPIDGGVVIRNMPNYNPESWDIFHIHTNGCMGGFDYIQTQINKKYDWTGILLSHFFKLNRHDSKKWFCSEIVRKALTQCKNTVIPDDGMHYKYNPQNLLDELKETKVI